VLGADQVHAVERPSLDERAQQAHELVELFVAALVPLLVEREAGESVVVEELAEELGELLGTLGGVWLPQHGTHLVVLGLDERFGLCGLCGTDAPGRDDPGLGRRALCERQPRGDERSGQKA